MKIESNWTGTNRFKLGIIIIKFNEKPKKNYKFRSFDILITETARNLKLDQLKLSTKSILMNLLLIKI